MLRRGVSRVAGPFARGLPTAGRVAPWPRAMRWLRQEPGSAVGWVPVHAELELAAESALSAVSRPCQVLSLGRLSDGARRCVVSPVLTLPAVLRGARRIRTGCSVLRAGQWLRSRAWHSFRRLIVRSNSWANPAAKPGAIRGANSGLTSGSRNSGPELRRAQPLARLVGACARPVYVPMPVGFAVQVGRTFSWQRAGQNFCALLLHVCARRPLPAAAQQPHVDVPLRPVCVRPRPHVCELWRHVFALWRPACVRPLQHVYVPQRRALRLRVDAPGPRAGVLFGCCPPGLSARGTAHRRHDGARTPPGSSIGHHPA